MGICTSKSQNSDEADINLISYQDELRHLYMITVLVNPARSRSSIKYYNNFKHQMEKAGVKLITVECAMDNCPFTVTLPNNEPYNIQIKTNSAFFQKERLFNVALNKLPLDAKYVLWCDYEVEFTQENWAVDAVKGLNVVRALQLFEDVSIMGQSKEEMKKVKGFAALNYKKNETVELQTFEESTSACGFAWGYRIEFLQEVAGLISMCPLGNNDKMMAYAMFDKIKDYVPKDILNDCFEDYLLNWQKKAVASLKTGVGFIPGLIKVNWINTPRDKSLYEKWNILNDNEFNYTLDLIVKEDGSYGLNPQSKTLITELKEHFTSLNGDNTQN